MKTYLECVPCFFKQILILSGKAGASRAKQKMLLNELAKILPKFSLNSSPPEMAKIIYDLISEKMGKRDFYAKEKIKSNRLALNIYPRLKRKVNRSKDRLLAAAELAIAGNIIDYGAISDLNITKELAKILSEETRLIKKENKKLFNFAEFKSALRKAGTVLYLGDNAGETVFDRVLIEEIKRADKNKKIIYAVKESPILNDALIEDALFCGIDKNAEIMSSGSTAPGTLLSLCSKDFLKIYKKADMVISKGQGNFEALSNAKREIFFLFMAKCGVIAGNAGCNINDIILLKHGGGKRKSLKKTG